MPDNAVTPAQLTDNWIAAARRQLASANRDALQRGLRHALAIAEGAASAADGRKPRGKPSVILAGGSSDLEPMLKKNGVVVHAVTLTPFDAAAAGKIRHFETYNRTTAAQRVQDIVAAARAHPESVLVAEGDAALAGLLAAAVSPVRLAILDVGTFDTSNDADYVERLYIPGIRRAGDLQTAAGMVGDRLVIHNAGERFALTGARVERAQLKPQEIVKLVRAR